MVDYWVSKERHYCKYCNVWMQGDRISIKHHEQGKRHKDKVEDTLKVKRQAKSNAIKSDRELRDQLKQIEEDAHIKYAQDMAKRRAPTRPEQSNAPPPPPRRPSQTNRINQPFLSSRPLADTVMSRQPSSGEYCRPPLELEEPVKEVEDDRGVYAVRGIVYLEGKKHSAQLETGSACQIWVEEVEQWIDALVEQATVHTVPNTALSFRRFTVMYMLTVSEKQETNEEPSKPMVEHEVLADRLRIPLPANVTLQAAEKMVDQWRNSRDAIGKGSNPHVAIDETTGMGEWSAVEVRQIDESPEAVAKRTAEAEAEAQRTIEKQERLDALDDFSMQGDNALGAYNPWGGTYKGVNLNEAGNVRVPRHEEEIKITTDGNVSFKKRGEKKHKRRRIHTEDQ